MTAKYIARLSEPCHQADTRERVQPYLPGFNYFWTVALAELLMFSVMSVGRGLALFTSLHVILRSSKHQLITAAGMSVLTKRIPGSE